MLYTQGTTDAQVIAIFATLTVAFIAVLLGILLNDARLNDFKEILQAEMQRNQSELLLKLSDIDHRLERLDTERQVIPWRTRPHRISQTGPGSTRRKWAARSISQVR